MNLLVDIITAGIRGIKFNHQFYEADINYTGGIRNSSRILYSNDGLVFVTYNHYFTFNQIC